MLSILPNANLHEMINFATKNGTCPIFFKQMVFKLAVLFYGPVPMTRVNFQTADYFAVYTFLPKNHIIDSNL